ncbi:hypothetical protein F5144DRAFT_117130 [Chaetomium tenue]|uniref:Uncharacterized protein n=1 Tax=Chaetomium tenue TaxID=1854479 RepID=A0ACB7PIP1_9PEZI|nr:hypothetical protein F5144DRAFT_117130 [Chaetomium globosum]
MIMMHTGPIAKMSRHFMLQPAGCPAPPQARNRRFGPGSSARVQRSHSGQPANGNPCHSPPRPTKTQMSNLAPVDDHFAHHQRRDNAASPNGSNSHRDNQHRRQDGNDLGMTTSRRSISPAAVAVNRTSDSTRERDRARKHHPPSRPIPLPQRSRGRSVEPPQQDTQRRRRDQARSPNRRSDPPFEPSHRSPRGRRDRSPEPTRRREPRASPDRRPPDHRSPGPRKEVQGRPDDRIRRRASRSPVPSKRRRSPSPSFDRASQPKKARQDSINQAGPERGVPPKNQQANVNRGLSPHPRRPRSPEPRDQAPKPSRRSGRSRSPSLPRRHRSRSPRNSRPFRQHPEGESRNRTRSPRHRHQSPRPDPRNRSRSRRRNSRKTGPADTRPPPLSDTGSRRRGSADQGQSHAIRGPAPSESPRESRRPQPTKRGMDSREPSRASKSFDPTSGANSIEVIMGARGGYRGGFNPQGGYPKGQYDARSYGQSSGHGTPVSSFHGSPTAQSPYGGNGRGWNNQPQFSPQGGQFSPTYPHNNYGPPTGPQGHYHSGQAQSPPYAPTGPAAQYPSGPRGSHRGGSFRGSQFSARGGLRGGFKSTQWHPQGNDGRGQPDPGEGSDPSHATTHRSPVNHTEAPVEKGDASAANSDNPFRPSKDLQVEDTSKEEESKEDKTPALGRAPPTGPQSTTPNKFSFSMKNAAKPAVAAPRPEISSKFNAAPASREPPTKPAAQKAPPTRPERDRERDRDRGFPKNAPTEPASARSRPGVPTGPSDRRAPEPPRQPDPTPRTRKVKKIVKRLKEKPTLPADLAASKSVFFRKPGNESVVGSGTYGKVFKGLNVYTKKLVALKKIRMEGERDGFPVTAVREIKLLRSLGHKNIVQLQEVMVEANDCFMVFEYLSHDLTGLLNHPTYTLEPGHKKHLARQLFEGLDYLHTRGVLHRDIKAANILVSNEGILKLADFGLARFYAKHHQLDYTNRVITIWYRSPELLLGETQYGPAVDIWSAACVLVEIFTKRAIFPGDGSEINQLEKIHAVLGTPNRKDWPNLVEMPWFALLRPTYRKPNVFAEKYKDQLTPAAFDLLTSMFHYDPDKRPTAAEVLKHPYFVSEEPAARQAIELKDIGGEWHELESKALRREKEKKEKERARAAQQQQSGAKEEAPESGSTRDRERKRPNEGGDAPREAKRPHIDANGKRQKAG